MSEYDSEPIRGLPELPPADEKILWQGAPSATAFTWRALHGREITYYFALFAGIVVTSGLMNGLQFGEAVIGAFHYVVLGAAAFALVALLAWLVHRTTVYTITTKRVVMRIGVALPLTLNIPFQRIAAADLKLNADGTGDIALRPDGPMPLAFWHLWPHMRAWRLRVAEPTLRCVPDASNVADVMISHMLASGVEGRVASPRGGAAVSTLSQPSAIPAPA